MSKIYIKRKNRSDMRDVDFDSKIQNASCLCYPTVSEEHYKIKK